MIILSSTILPISGEVNSINNIDINISENNISRDIIDVLNAKKVGSKPFILGASKLGGEEVLSSFVDYYIGKQGSNANGYFSSPYIITIYGNQIQELVIRFDTLNHQHPNGVEINGVYYICESDILRIGNLNKQNIYTIKIDNWNTPYYPLRIQGIYTLYVEIDSNKILSGCSIDINDRWDFEKPDYGIISNGSEFTFIDYDGDILFYAEQQVMVAGLELLLYIKNIETNYSELIGRQYTSTWNYDNNNRQCRVSLQDDLIDLHNINTPKKRLTANVTLEKVYQYLRELTPSKYYFASLDAEVSEFLSKTTLKYFWLEKSSLWEQWDKFCKAGGLYLYKNKKNRISISFGD